VATAQIGVRRYVIKGESAGTTSEKPRSDLKRLWSIITREADLGGLLVTQAATTQRYPHLNADPLRRASDTIGNTHAAAMDDIGPSKHKVI